MYFYFNTCIETIQLDFTNHFIYNFKANGVLEFFLYDTSK